MYFAKDAARFAAEVALASQTGGIHKKKNTKVSTEFKELRKK